MAPEELHVEATLIKKAGDALDYATFEQILQMDDDEDEREFSREIVFDFFQQAESTFKNMDTALGERDLEELSSLGHFLKGSSATLGLTKVKDSCEKIQHIGSRKDETGSHDELDDDKSLEKLDGIIKQTKKDFEVIEKLMREFYEA
ncbi:histidine-phosphotransfer domain, HPT domain-containing protein [Pseudovirgaria hyperparasitica]|uniref:Histidine-phosphotransfer domain, HPT domain-containing protein n=1 Tax=Pseudovirgaria hyperparasitica TaxID=470096 RepID=A0A6A6WF94_9PEZI|nr:histidine-phosphotransfer domain, HPT domain-containing protein [Pseudovirgaria hyperparasitica]KAF2760556.1 histidine-phosphotransfer domain, HPT domain-containing protein [Pseudovirgaria hyperparasitica]